jgi:hypothetical protein
MANPTSVYQLEPGVVYIVTKRFDDYYSGKFEAGELLTFECHHFLPYHGGYTIVFRERAIYLQENDQSEILCNLANYLAVHDDSGRLPPQPPPPAPKGESDLSYFITGLAMVAGFIGLWIFHGRANFAIVGGILLFGAGAAISGIDWWRSRRANRD